MFSFGDGFDCYATPGDALFGYWDSGTGTPALSAGRFAGSQCIYLGNGPGSLTKASNVNDAAHHFVLAFRQTLTLTGSNMGFTLQLLDGTTGQCCVVFRSDGAIVLTSGTGLGTVLATYTGAVALINTWYAFEIEVLISNTGGYMNVRKNGNPVNDFTSATNLNTRVSANNYANKLTIVQTQGVSAQNVDDLYWRSDATSVPWMGDIRCYTRAPASDAAVQFSRAPANYVQTTVNGGIAGGSSTPSANLITYIPFTPSYTGSVGSLTLTCSTTSTGNWKCAIYNNTGSGGSAGTILGTATPFSAPGVGACIVVFPTPVAVTAGVIHWVGIGSDSGSGAFRTATTSSTVYYTTSGYAAFPVNNPAVSTTTQNSWHFAVNYSPANNYMMVAEPQQDATTSYVYDSVVGHSDLYGIAAITSTPLTTFAVTTRAYMIKSDAGTRTAAVQLRSGGTTDASPTVVLTPSNWQWAWKHYTSDPAGGAWSAAAVNVCNIGPLVVA